MTLLAALARAGSTTPPPPRSGDRADAAPGQGPAKRSSPKPSGGSREAAGGQWQNITLIDGDTVNIPKAQSVFVSGEVKSPGAYAVESGMTVLQVLTLAGGLTDPRR